MKSMKPKELDIFLEFSIYDKVNLQIDKTENHKWNKNNFIELMEHKAKINDFKSPLWMVLPLKEKVMMWMSQTDLVEFKLMTFMILKEVQTNFLTLKSIDKELEGTVNNLVGY